MPAKKEDKAKAISSSAKQKKKKWSKSKTREKVSNLVVFDKPTYDKLLKEIPTAKLITPAVVSERLKVNGSLARRAIRELIAKGLVKTVINNHRQIICTRLVNVDAAAPAADAAAASGKKPAAKGGKKPAAKAEETTEEAQ